MRKSFRWTGSAGGSPALPVLSLLLAVLAGHAVAARSALAVTLLPLLSEEAQTLPSAHTEVVLASRYSRNQRFPYFTPAGAIREQDLISAPHLALRIGVGDWAEVQASFEMLYRDEQLTNGDDSSDYGSGDARLFTKVRVLRQGDWYPALGVRFGTKLPNASLDHRLGTDEIDFEIALLASQDFGFASAHCNLGLGLLGNPGPAIRGDTSFQSGGQDDLFLWSVAMVSRPLPLAPTLALRALAEVAGNAGSRFDNDRAEFQAGGQLQYQDWTLFLGAGFGLITASADVTASGGVIYSFDLASLW